MAQEPVERPATHTVKKGDTLWDLAQQYLGDPFQWPQIYQINTALIKDPHWIYPGQEFKLPGGASPTGALEAAGAPMQAVDTSMTVFNPASNRSETRSRESLLLAAFRTAVRPGEFEASPFMWAIGGPQDGGAVDGSGETNAIPSSAALRPLQFREQVVVTMPRGLAAARGMKLLAYRLGPIVPGQGQVVVPTGVVEVVSALDGGHARGFVLRKYEDMFAGHGVSALDSLAMPVGVFPSRVEFGISTSVAWLHMNPSLSTSGQKLIFAAGAGSGIVPGDQLTIRVPGGTDAGGALQLAVAQVTRVTPWGVSASILEVLDGGLTVGLRAQVSAKMP